MDNNAKRGRHLKAAPENEHPEQPEKKKKHVGRTVIIVIAAVVLGGPRVGGGYGNVTGTLLGVLLITLINNSLVMLKIPTFWQSAATGLIIILGTVAQMYRYKHSVNAEKGA